MEDKYFYNKINNTFTKEKKKKENDFIMASLVYIPVLLASNLFSSLKKVLTTKIAQMIG